MTQTIKDTNCFFNILNTNWLFDNKQTLENRRFVFDCNDVITDLIKKPDLSKKIAKLNGTISFSISDYNTIFIVDSVNIFNEAFDLTLFNNKDLIIHKIIKNDKDEFRDIIKILRRSAESVNYTHEEILDQGKGINIIHINELEYLINQYYKKTISYHFDRGLSNYVSKKRYENGDNIISIMYEKHIIPINEKFDYVLLDLQENKKTTKHLTKEEDIKIEASSHNNNNIEHAYQIEYALNKN